MSKPCDFCASVCERLMSSSGGSHGRRGRRRSGSGRKKGTPTSILRTRGFRLSMPVFEQYYFLRNSGHYACDDDFISHLLDLEQSALRRGRRSALHLLVSFGYHHCAISPSRDSCTPVRQGYEASTTVRHRGAAPNMRTRLEFSPIVSASAPPTTVDTMEIDVTGDSDCSSETDTSIINVRHLQCESSSVGVRR